MGKRIVVIQGHPDSGASHLCHALAQSYREGAGESGHELRTIDVAALEFPLVRTREQWEHGELPAALRPAQQAIGWSEHVALFFPLWLGDMPALLKAFLEQVMRPGFAFAPGGEGSMPAKGLTGRSARVVVTMGMPAALYRFYFRAHSVKSLERNILGLVGIAPVDETLIGSVEALTGRDLARWFARMRALGRDAA